MVFFLRQSAAIYLYLIVFCGRPETASDVISGMFVGPIVRNIRVKFCNRRLNGSREIPPEAVGGAIFGRFLNADNFRPEVASDVIFSVFTEPTGVDVPANFVILC